MATMDIILFVWCLSAENGANPSMCFLKNAWTCRSLFDHSAFLVLSHQYSTETKTKTRQPKC